jgi:hypothetical protein
LSRAAFFFFKFFVFLKRIGPFLLPIILQPLPPSRVGFRFLFPP